MTKTYSTLYLYDPSYGAAIAAIAVFGVLSILHTYQFFATRTWFFTAFLLGGFCMHHGASLLYHQSLTCAPVELIGFVAVSGFRRHREAI